MMKQMLSLLLAGVILLILSNGALIGVSAEMLLEAENIVISKDKTEGDLIGQIGDSDNNGTVNIRDATNIQKYAAGLVTFSARALSLGDVDNNENVNVRDATGIQKYLAGISVDSNIMCYMYIIGEHAHSYLETVIAPGCEKGGYTLHSCVCGDEYKDNYTATINHSYKSKVTAPTCTEQGYTTYTCTVCQSSYVADYKPMAAHTYKSSVINPTCTSTGYTVYTCSSCGDSYKADYTQGSHKYTAKVTEPTCKTQGFTTYTCSDCGNSYKDNYTSTVSHSYNSSGVCSMCGASKPVTNSKAVAFDKVALWMISNGSLTSDGESYIFYDPSISVGYDYQVALFYNYYEETIEIYWTNEDKNWDTWVTITRGSNYADYVLMVDDYLIASGSFATNSITENTSYLGYDYIYNPYGISASSIKEGNATAVKLALTYYNSYDLYYSMPSSLYELGFTNYTYY